jgi:hypothetical protein
MNPILQRSLQRRLQRTSLLRMLVAGGGLLVVGGGAFWLGRARADGVPAPDTLYYSGTLEEQGVPVTGTRNIQIRIGLWDSPPDAPAGCVSGGDVAVSSGRFRLPLSAGCTKQIRDNPSLYVQLGVQNEMLPRRKLGAVPFAVEAGRASEAAGALDERIKALEMQQPARSGFYAYKSANQLVGEEDECVVVQFPLERYDFANEYDQNTSIFKVKDSGYYQITCSVMFDMPEDKDPQPALHVVAVIKNGTCTTDFQVVSNSFYGNSTQAAVNASAMVKLEANETLACVAYQALSGGQRVIQANAQYFQSRNYFSVVRVF